MLRLAILIRVIASWLGVSPYSQIHAGRACAHRLAGRPDPQRLCRPIGMFDISPLVAYFVLYLAEQVVMRGLF